MTDDTKRRDELAEALASEITRIQWPPKQYRSWPSADTLIALDILEPAKKFILAGWDARDDEVAELNRKLSAVESLYAERDDDFKAYNIREDALQAQLAKAREALEFIESDAGDPGSFSAYALAVRQLARAALAELEKDVGLHDRTSKLQIQQVDVLRAQKEKAKETLKKCLHARQCNAPWGQTEKYPSVEEFKRVLSEMEEA